MKHTKVVLSLLLISSASMVLAHSTATPYFNIRSQSANLALEMVGQEQYINRYESDGNYTVFSVTPAYQQSFRSSDLACCLFGQDLVKSGDCSQLTISGSQFANRGSKDWLADYFGLPTDFKSTIQFNPRIQNVLVDANFFFGLDEWWHPGMFFKMHIPFVHTRWELDYCETVSAKGVNDHPFGYFAGNSEAKGTTSISISLPNSRSELLCNVQSFFSDCQSPNLSNNKSYGEFSTSAGPNLRNITYTDDIIFEPLNYARWAGCNCSPLTKSGVAEWRFTLGYNAYMSDKFHVGFGVTGAAPTGNRPHGQFLFEPIIGNGNHWELGGQFTSHYRFWQSEDEEKSFTGYLDVNLTHLFKTRQTRSFDLKGKPNSRYMLAQKLGTPVCYLNNAIITTSIDPVTSGPAFLRNAVGYTQASAQFKDEYAPVANLTTVDVDVNIGAQIDLVFMLNYTAGHLSFDFGYNLWARTCERIKLNCKCPTRLNDGRTWALKGDAHVYSLGLINFKICTTPCEFPVLGLFLYEQSTNGIAAIPLGATQSKATIHSGTNINTINVKGILENNNPVDFTNQGIDHPRLGLATINGKIEAGLSPATATPAPVENAIPLCDGSENRPKIMNSKKPIFITENDLDLDGAATKGLSHKVFGHVSYQWPNDERDYVPFLGLGGSAEFATNDGDCCPTSCPTTTSSSSSCGSSSSTCCKTDCKTDCKEKCKLSCKRCALSQWSVWLKGGFSFD